MGRRAGAVGTLGVAAVAVGMLTAAVAAVAAGVTVVYARRVVIPSPIRPDEERIVGVDLAAGVVALAASDETRMRGRYGLWFEHDSGYARMGDVIDEDERVVRRRVESVDFGRLDRATHGRVTSAPSPPSV